MIDWKRYAKWAGITVAAVVLVCIAWSVFAGSVQPPDRLTASACAARVHAEGREVAMARWNLDMTRAAALALPFSDEAPNWVRSLVTGWIEDAYKFQGEPSQWLAKILHECQSIAES